MKKPLRYAAFLLLAAAAAALFFGCGKESGSYLKIDDEEADDAVYIYYLKSSMYRVMAMYGAESSTEAFWTAELLDGETPFETALSMASEKTTEEYIIGRLFDESPLSWDDEKQAKFEERYDAVSVGGRSYKRFLSASGLTDEAWRFITKNAVKRAALNEYYKDRGKSLEDEISRLVNEADVKTDRERISALVPTKIIP